MPTRKNPFVNNEIYHLFNRGTEKRNIFKTVTDMNRFLLSMRLFNQIRPTNSIRNARGRTLASPPLVDFICYCLNPNHFHFLIEQLTTGGISEFMKRLGGGYTCYFNEKYKRSGSLFQGKFKSVYIKDNTQLLHTSAYINLNNRLKGEAPMLSKSSWKEYLSEEKFNLCKKDLILNQFRSREDYKMLCLNSLKDIVQRKILEKELKEIGL